MDLDDIKREMARHMAEQNKRYMPDFEGYSPHEMHHILHFTFGSESPIKIQHLSAANYKKIPILNQVRYLAGMIRNSGELKLTAKGYLPTQMVAELYAQGFIKDRYIESGISKLYKETDAIAINLARVLIELTGVAKKRNGKLSLTKKGETTVQDDAQLFSAILESFTKKFNWGYYDGYDAEPIGTLGFGFSLILLSKYGNEKREAGFYAEKYFRAFPQLLDMLHPTYRTLEEYSADCYSLRTFELFMAFFGLVTVDEKIEAYKRVTYVSKTELFDQLIVVQPHRKG